MSEVEELRASLAGAQAQAKACGDALRQQCKDNAALAADLTRVERERDAARAERDLARAELVSARMELDRLRATDSPLHSGTGPRRETP